MAKDFYEFIPSHVSDQQFVNDSIAKIIDS